MQRETNITDWSEIETEMKTDRCIFKILLKLLCHTILVEYVK